MKSTVFRSLILTAVLATAALNCFGQGPAPQPSAPGSIFDGEKLIYDAKVRKLKLNLAVAELTFTAVGNPPTNQLVIKSEAVSKGTMLRIFRYSFLQEYESIVDINSFNIQRTTKHDVQKERVRDSVAIFDYDGKLVTYIETDPKDLNRPPRRIASDVGGQMNDMISAIYALRLQELKVGKRFELSVSDSGLVYKVPVLITKRERQNSLLGQVWCLRVEPELFGPNRLIERKGKMVIWMTDDANHTPIRAKIDTEYGNVEIKLKSVITSN